PGARLHPCAAHARLAPAPRPRRYGALDGRVVSRLARGHPRPHALRPSIGELHGPAGDRRVTTPTCRFCDAPLTLTLVDLGEQPLSNAYLSLDQLDKPEPKYPLHARVCRTCRLVQVDAVQTPDHIFSDYAYFSSI